MTVTSQSKPHQGLSTVEGRIRDAEAKAGRAPNSVKLIAVSKTFDAEAIRPVLDAGHSIFGENRVQESLSKWPDLKSDYDDVELHLIGPLQSNKTKEAVGLFDCIQTLDRPKLARVLAETFETVGRTPRLFVQVNTGKEEQKAGILPDAVDRFVEECRSVYGLSIEGLMCIPPINEEAALHFALLASIAERNGIDQLSMGMRCRFRDSGSAWGNICPCRQCHLRGTAEARRINRRSQALTDLHHRRRSASRQELCTYRAALRRHILPLPHIPGATR